jgi:exoribonuclease R
MVSLEWNNIFNQKMDELLKEHIIYNSFNKDNITLDPTYGLINRTNLKHLEIYSIDPPNCTDADDAFSIWEENNEIHLMIHIADPTSWFSPNDDVFKDIIENAQTIYISGREPKHLFNKLILDNSTLTYGERNVVSVHSIFTQSLNDTNMFTLNKSQIEYCIINCNNHHRFTYEEAANNLFNNNILLLGLTIAKIFQKNRTVNLKTINITTPYLIENEVILQNDNTKIAAMKMMIAEFAIHANTIFASGLNDNSIFLRSLIIPNNININNNNIDIVHELIKEGISAKYTNIKIPHELINNDLYTHSTSPLRRASDCIVHFLLKAQYLGIECPFTNHELKNIADKLTIKSKFFKNIQFKDIKLRTFQWIAEELESRLNPIKIKYKILNYKNDFLNLIIFNIDNINVNIPYSLKRKNIKSKIINIDYNKEYNINITKINYYNKYDEGTLIELDNSDFN